MKKMRLTVLLTVLCLIAAEATALEVDKNELESTGANTIEFQNYTGPHSVIDSLAAIKAIGSGLGSSVAGNVNKAGTIGSPNNKYYVIHAVDSTQKDLLDADILFIGAQATVDHINNVRYIIASYLTSAYGYSEKDASTIATFVTVYNAVYRGKLDVFKGKYKTVVMNNLTEDKCGMSTKWNEWAGRSQIVIPLNDLNGGLSTVDTSVISDKQVVKSMKEEDNKGVDERKNMVDIKEREADTATEKAQTSQKVAAQETKKADDQQKKADTAQKQADTAQKQADEAKKESDQAKKAAAEDPNNKQKQQQAEEKAKTAEQKQEAADQKQQTADQEQKKADEQQQKADEASKVAEKQQDIADKKQSEAQAERTEIAKDQQKLLQDALAEAANKNAVIGLHITDTATNMSGMVKVDGVTGDIIRESPVTVIRGRTILPAGIATVSSQAEGDAKTKDNKTASDKSTDTTTTPSVMYMAICGENTKTGAVKLCLLDGNSMEIQKESDEVVAEDSVLVQNGSDYYCVIQDGKNWVVGKYDASLKIQLKSPVTVVAETPITVTPNGIVVSGSNGKVILLKLSDLTAVSKATASSTDAASAK